VIACKKYAKTSLFNGTKNNKRQNMCVKVIFKKKNKEKKPSQSPKSFEVRELSFDVRNLQ